MAEVWAGRPGWTAHAYRETTPDAVHRPVALCHRLWLDEVADFEKAKTSTDKRCKECEQALAEEAKTQTETQPTPKTANGETTMPLLTVGTGAPDVEPGTYPVTLLGIEPKTIVPQQGKNAGEDVDVLEWTFTIDEGDTEGTEIRVISSLNSGPKSKMFSFLTALLGGKAPVAGTSFEASDLAGRQCLAQIITDESGWPRIAALVAKQASRRSAPKPEAEEPEWQAPPSKASVANARQPF